MIPGAFLSDFCSEIRKACSVDLPPDIMEPQGKTLDNSKAGTPSERWVVHKRKEEDHIKTNIIFSFI